MKISIILNLLVIVGGVALAVSLSNLNKRVVNLESASYEIADQLNTTAEIMVQLTNAVYPD